jgi:hypothetical protein
MIERHHTAFLCAPLVDYGGFIDFILNPNGVFFHILLNFQCLDFHPAGPVAPEFLGSATDPLVNSRDA